MQHDKSESLGCMQPDSVPESCDDFGNELLECITGMSPQEVHISVDVCYNQR